MAYPITTEQILNATNGGLAIFVELFDIKDVRKNFKLRNEKHASANLFESGGQWKVKDFGDTSFYFTPQTAINAYMHERGLGFYEALRELASQYGIIQTDVKAFQNFEKKLYHEFEGKLNEDEYEVVTKDFTPAELDILGPLMTQDVCQKYNIYSVKSYSWLIALKKDESPNTALEFRNVGTKFSSDFYPIFALIEKGKEYKIEVDGSNVQKRKGKDFVKIMQPKDANSRFRYFGFKPQDHIFGVDQLNSMPKPTIEVQRKDVDGNLLFDDDSNPMMDRFPADKHKRVFIACGERDSLNVASLGFPVVWFNSETAQISEIQIKSLYKQAEEIVYIPDMDHTGIERASKLALEFIDLRVAWLPKYLTQRTGWNGKSLKDFTDWMKISNDSTSMNREHITQAFNIFVNNGMTAKFWTPVQKINADGIPYGPITYQINHINAFHFLKLNGIHKVVDPNNDERTFFVQQDGHVISNITADRIKSKFVDFVKEKRAKYGLRFYPDSLLNMLYSTEAISDKRLAGLEVKEFNFADCTPTSQYFFFQDFIWNITKDGIEDIRNSKGIFCKEENLINNKVKKQRVKNRELGNVKIDEDYFTVTKDKDGNYDIKITEQNCDFLNYLINASRVHWKDETKGMHKDAVQEWQKLNKNTIFGALKDPENPDKGYLLNDDQIFEQKGHLINKLYALGYMLHSYKDDSKAWMVYGMDNEIVDDSKSFGRSGKSLMFHKAMFLFKESLYIGARNPKIIENEFLFNNVTEQTKFILFDDADKYFPVKRLFTWVTGDLNVNVKNKDPFVIPFFNSAKLAYNTNFAPTDLDPSLMSRILYTAHGDWYHGISDVYHEYKPNYDFGGNFFRDWDNLQWAKFINLLAQALKLFLASPDKLEAPENNIKKRSLIADMGKSFHEWAIDYFTDDRLNIYIDKKTAYENLKHEKHNLKNISSTEFKVRVGQYCELNNLIFCPIDLITDKKNKRIMKNNFELLYLQTQDRKDEKILTDDDMP